VVQVFVKDVEAAPAGSDATIWAVLAPGIKARLRCNELSFAAGDALAQKMLKNLTNSFKPGQALTAQVLSVHADRHLVDVALLPLGSTKPRVFDPELLARVHKAAAAAAASHNELRPGVLVSNLTVKKVLPHVGLLVSFHAGRPHAASEGASSSSASSEQQHEKIGRIHITDLSDRWTSNPLDAFSVGQKIPAAVVLEVSARAAKEENAMEEDDEEEQDGKPASSSSAKGTHQQVDLSLRPSRLAAAGSAAAASSKKQKSSALPEVTDLDSLVGKEGSYVQGYVKSTSKAGCFVALSHSVDARCLLKNLSDSFVTDVARSFPPGKLLPRVRIVSVDPAKRTVEVSLRKSDGAKGGAGGAGGVGGDTVGPNGLPLYTYESLNVGDVVRGVVTQVKPFGVFIKLAQSSLSGLAHISECSDARIADLGAHYEAGDKVRAKVVKKDDAARKVSLGLKAKYFEGLPPVSDDEEEDEEELAEDEGDSDEEGDLQIPDDEEGEDEEEEEAPPTAKKARASPAAAPAAAASSIVPPLPGAGDDDTEMAAAPALSLDMSSSLSMLTSGASNPQAADETDGSDDDDDEDDEEGEDGSKTPKKSRRAKAGAKKALEKSLRARELSVLDSEAQPESAEDYERLLVQDPNSSMVWIKYMAHQSQFFCTHTNTASSTHAIILFLLFFHAYH
jgi:rRNA biogenesis protein RRP5